MNCKARIVILLTVVFLPNHVLFAQSLDPSVAEALGLVKPINTLGSTPRLNSQRSGVFDIELNVGKRMELVFPEQGALSLKSNDQHKFEILNINNSLFIEAISELEEPVTAIFTLRPSQQIVLLNLSTVSQDILVSSRMIQPPSLGAPANGVGEKKVPPTPGPSRVRGDEYDHYVALAAFAARVAYAPDRLLAAPKGVRKVEFKVAHRQLQKLSRDRRLIIKPLSSWVHRGLHVTVLEISNTGSEPLALTADLLRGRFVARSFQHNHIGVSDRDRYSAAYVISQAPFQSVVEAL